MALISMQMFHKGVPIYGIFDPAKLSFGFLAGRVGVKKLKQAAGGSVADIDKLPRDLRKKKKEFEDARFTTLVVQN